MEKEFQKIDEGITRLHDLHKIHMESFSQESLPDLEQQSLDRGIEVGMLMKSVDKLVRLIETQPWKEAQAESMIFEINGRIETLLEQNETFEKKVIEFQDKLKNGMKQISQGKKVISSYRSAAAVSNNPKVISITNY